MSRGARLLLNPTAARGRSTGLLDPLRSRAGLEIVVTRDAEEMTAQARRAAADGLDRVLVAGGDGSLHHAAQGLAGTSCALGVVPLGTGNDLARALDLDPHPVRAAEAALTGPARRIDVGRAGDRLFVGVAGVGFDAEVNRFVNRRDRRVGGRWAFPWAVLRTLGSFQPPRLSIEAESESWEGRVVLAALGNSPLFGGGMRIAPGARLDDGWLDLVVVERIPKLKLLLLFPRVYRGSHVRHPRVRSRRVRAATFRADSALTFYADGEPWVPVSPQGTTIEIWPGALAVIAGGLNR